MLIRIVLVVMAVTVVGIAGYAQQYGELPGDLPGQTIGVAGPPHVSSVTNVAKGSSEINKVIRQLKEAKDDDAREAALDALQTALAADYDTRLDAYETEIDRMQSELDEMRDLLVRRRAAKRDMIQLRMQLLEAEAVGLGWPSGIVERNVFVIDDLGNSFQQRRVRSVRGMK